MRVAGIDYGAARIGIAIGDISTGIATPWSVLQRKTDEQVIQDLKALFLQEGVEQVVVGVPRPLSDQHRETEQAKQIRGFIETLKQLGLEVEEENETWSSSLAAKQGIEVGSKGKRDDLAAANILQGYLDRRVGEQ